MKKADQLRILIVVSPENSKVAQELFDGDYNMTISTSLSNAQEMLKKKYDLIAAATCFDESRMFDLLRYCKATPHIQSTPLIALRIDGIKMDDMTHQAVQIATKALGAEEYIDLQRMPGDVNAKSIAFRIIISMLLEKKRFEI
jgi:hypothetical protein